MLRLCAFAEQTSLPRTAHSRLEAAPPRDRPGAGCRVDGDGHDASAAASFPRGLCPHGQPLDSNRDVSSNARFIPRFPRASPSALTRIMHEPPATTADLAVLPGVLGSRTLRRTDKYVSGSSPCGCPVARPSPRSRGSVSCIMRVNRPFRPPFPQGDGSLPLVWRKSPGCRV